MSFAVYALSLIVTTSIAYLLLVYKKTWRIRRCLENVPGPEGWPLIGSAIEMNSNLQRILYHLQDCKRTYGDLFKFQIGPDVVLVVSDTQFMEKVLNSTKTTKKSPEYKFFDRWLATGLLTSSGKKWHQRRKAITPTFHYDILAQFVATFDRNGRQLIEKLEERLDDERVDLFPIITLYTLDVICETAMGITMNAQNHDSDYVNAIKRMDELIIARAFTITKRFDAIYKLTGAYKEEIESLKIIHETADAVIKQRRELLLRNDGSNEEYGAKKRVAFLDMLMQCTIDGQPLSDLDIREEVDTFMFAGHDTTASAISFTLFALSQHGDVQAKAYEEVVSICGTDANKPITFDDLKQMKYLELVIKEALRLYPAVPMIGRELTTDVTIGDKHCPAGLILFLFVYGIHMDPKVYPDPEKFVPERFLDVKTERGAFSYLPFSAGPRNCIGQKYAMLELKASLSLVLRHFQLLPIENFEVRLLYATILKSRDGLPVKLRRR